MQTNEGIAILKNATTEGYLFIPDKDKYKGNARVYLSPELLNSFEEGDQRRKGWIDSTMQDYFNPPQSKVWYPAKYKVGAPNSVAGAPQEEFQMVLRLGELYLIRAEARANGADGGASKAVEDLNAIRYRASLPLLPVDLNATAVKVAVEKERKTELFAEWGHRWFDLKRTGRASAVISVLPGKTTLGR